MEEDLSSAAMSFEVSHQNRQFNAITSLGFIFNSHIITPIVISVVNISCPKEGKLVFFVIKFQLQDLLSLHSIFSFFGLLSFCAGPADCGSFKHLCKPFMLTRAFDGVKKRMANIFLLGL